ncbi:3-phosphoserine/phosphohydroxythreonine transaminase [Massilia sp. W12]|uniref:3-phosphoserine/phosphohydroxythreonine transaminase n=1 Tax=Massilia sp. W12 TaxID=3126507 RepID=UPI0030D34032
MSEVFNFSAGPAVLPKEVLAQAAAEMLDWHGSGMSVMEMSHRGPEFMQIHQQALDDLRELLQVPAHYKILFLQGGGMGENAIVPLNLLGRKPQEQRVIDFVHSGAWSGKSIKEAHKYASVNVAASSEAQGFSCVPDPASWRLRDDAAYLHVCTNETIHGVEFPFAPQAARPDIPVVADMSSHILSKAIRVADYGVIFAGAQKNIGPAGLTIVLVREDLLGGAMSVCPTAFDWSQVAANNSMLNTPPTWGIYIAGLVFQWIKREGGVAALEARNKQKADLLYACLEKNQAFYRIPVQAPFRSRMNVPFFLRDDNLNASFLAQAKEAGLLQLKGHKSVGGMRASIYNAMPLPGVIALTEFLDAFARRHG